MFQSKKIPLNEQAREAYARGDRIFQCHRKVKQSGDFQDDAAEVLNSICREGWELVNASFVSSVATSVVGYYVFKRDLTSPKGLC